MRALLLFILSLATAQSALAQGSSPWTQSQFFNCVPSIKPGPLSRGLGFLWINIGGLQTDLVHGSYGVATGNGNYTPEMWGESADVGTGGISFENEPAVVTTDNGAGTGGFSLVVLAYEPPSSSNNGYVFSLGNSGNVVWMTANSLVQNGGQGNGEIAVNTYDGTNSTGYVTPQSTLNFSGHVFIATISNAAPWQLYMDGVAKTFTLGTTSSSYLSVSGTKAGVGGYHNGSIPMAGSGILFAAEYNRILTTSEIAALSSDPASKVLKCPS